MINIMEKNMKKNVDVCITESLWFTAEINTTLYINYTSIENNCFKKNTYIYYLLIGSVSLESWE